MSATRPQPPRPIESVGRSRKNDRAPRKVMDALLATVEEETALCAPAGCTRRPSSSRAKAESPRLCRRQPTRIKASRDYLQQSLPDALAALRRRHDKFRALLQINLTVLATAHAVSEGIMRGVSGELARKRAPQTYGASGRANVPGPKAGQPLAVSRVL